VIADTVYSAALEMPFISTRRSHPPHRRLRYPPHLALAANVWFKLEHVSLPSTLSCLCSGFAILNFFVAVFAISKSLVSRAEVDDRLRQPNQKLGVARSPRRRARAIARRSRPKWRLRMKCLPDRTCGHIRRPVRRVVVCNSSVSAALFAHRFAPRRFRFSY